MMCGPIGWIVWGIGFWERVSFGSGGVMKAKLIRLSYFTAGT